MESASAISPDLSSNNKKKVCLIVGINFPSIFLVDLDFNYDVDANGFAEMKPNFRVVCPGMRIFCVVDATLCILRFHPDGLSSVVPELYSIDLQAASEMSDSRLGMTQLTRCPNLFPKVQPRSVAYRGNLLTFSTEIPYEPVRDVDSGYADAIDFELYNLNSQKSTALPRLIVCREGYEEDKNIFMLFNADKECYYDEFPACPRRGWDDTHFLIVSSVVDEESDRFIIQTDFGRMFSLNLDGGTDCRWRLCEEGYEIMSRKNIVRDGICFSGFMANDSRKRWLQQQSRKCDQDRGDGDGRKRAKMGYGDVRSLRSLSIPFPLLEIDMDRFQYADGPLGISFDLLKCECDPCMLLCTARQLFDIFEFGFGGCVFSKLYMVLDVWMVNSEEFPEAFYQDDSVDKFLKRVTSFKFFVSERNFTPGPYVIGLFYY